MNSIFYLKVNRDIDYAYYCIEYWLKVARKMKAITYVICDNDAFQNKIKKSVNPNNLKDVCFMKSMTKEVESISLNVATKRWKKAADAHLTTFYHAMKMGYESFWNIDADDTSFETSIDETVNILSAAEAYAQNNKLAAFGLDMWWTIHKGDNWTFGITYTNMNVINWFQIIGEHERDEEYRKLPSNNENLDGYFNYLRNKLKLPIESFYVKNTFFIHWGAPFGPLTYEFLDGEVVFPRKIEYLFTKTMKYGKRKIEKEIIPIDMSYFYKNYKKQIHKRRLKSISNIFGISPLVYMIKNGGIESVIALMKKEH